MTLEDFTVKCFPRGDANGTLSIRKTVCLESTGSSATS